MKFNSAVNFFIPTDGGNALIPSGANNCYIVHKQRTIRIVPAADMYIKFSDDKSMSIADNTNILLKADQEYFVNSGEFDFMSASVATANIIICKNS